MRPVPAMTLLLLTATAHAQTTPADAPAAQPLTLGERFNFWFDNLEAVLGRVMDLPLFFLVLISLVIAALAALLAARIARRFNKPLFYRAVITGGGVLLLLVLALLADRRNTRLQEELTNLRTAASAAPVAVPTPVVTTGTQPAAPIAPARFLTDLAAAKAALAPTFPGITLSPRTVHPAVDFVQLQCPDPLIKACIAIINLRTPGLQIKLGTNLQTKTLTSTFAKEHSCIVAINGEAGNTPLPNSGLGPWSGFFISEGKTILKESPGNPRPFLSFTSDNHASFTPLSAPAPRSAPADAHNLIWGRLDALVNGTVLTENFRNLQPRTAMGINKDGSLLYLLVVDGRQPRAAQGFTRAEVGQTLKAFGAHSGMLCDEGGSSCLYLNPPGRIMNVPSDNFGQERTTYTHFGISITP